MGFGVAALIFWRMWRQSNDRFFVLFTLAFGVFAAERLALARCGVTTDSSQYFYVFRLAGFLLTLLAIADKNRRP